ncbi:DUF6406 domain-containing protein [Spirillospora sp. NPDC048824]|uniref:DUF6406 domain-containing protein n=1 Tax=Spirillospora sp. NPDC048824 TaxID=3364526 RepID=UPI003721671B
MAIEEISLKGGTQAHLDAGMKIGLVSIREEQDDTAATVVIATLDHSEHDFLLHPGDTFPLGDQTWELTRVESPSGRSLTAVFARIE